MRRLKQSTLEETLSNSCQGAASKRTGACSRRTTRMRRTPSMPLPQCIDLTGEDESNSEQPRQQQQEKKEQLANQVTTTTTTGKDGESVGTLGGEETAEREDAVEMALEMAEMICEQMDKKTLLRLLGELRMTRCSKSLKMAALRSVGLRLGFKFKHTSNAYFHTLNRLRKRTHCFECGSRAKICPKEWCLVPKCLACLSEDTSEGTVYNTSEIRSKFKYFKKFKIWELERTLGGCMRNIHGGYHYFVPHSLASKIFY